MAPSKKSSPSASDYDSSDSSSKKKSSKAQDVNTSDSDAPEDLNCTQKVKKEKISKSKKMRSKKGNVVATRATQGEMSERYMNNCRHAAVKLGTSNTSTMNSKLVNSLVYETSQKVALQSGRECMALLKDAGAPQEVLISCAKSVVDRVRAINVDYDNRTHEINKEEDAVSKRVYLNLQTIAKDGKTANERMTANIFMYNAVQGVSTDLACSGKGTNQTFVTRAVNQRAPSKLTEADMIRLADLPEDINEEE